MAVSGLLSEVKSGAAMPADFRANDAEFHEIVDTAVALAITKLDFSISVSNLSCDQAITAVPRPAVEAFCLQPGICAKASGIDGNDVFAVRGQLGARG